MHKWSWLKLFFEVIPQFFGSVFIYIDFGKIWFMKEYK